MTTIETVDEIVGQVPFLDEVSKELLQKKREIYATGVVSAVMAHTVILQLKYLASESNKPITLYLNTAGGSVVDGLALYDIIRLVAKQVPVKIVAVGSCMSMGAIILQAATKRLCLPNTAFLLHELQALQVGSIGILKDRQAELERVQQVLNNIVLKRTKLTEKSLKKLVERKDLYLNAEEAKKYKLVDEILHV